MPLRFAHSVLVLGIIFLALILVYVGVGHERFLSSPARIATNAGLPILGICLIAGAFWLRPDTRLTIAIILTSVAVSVWGFELALTAEIFPSDRANAEAFVSPAHDNRTTNMVVMDLRASGIRSYPPVPSSYILRLDSQGAISSRLSIDDEPLLSLAGVRDTRTPLCNETGTWFTFQSDQYGFNNPNDVWAEAESDVVAVGDSFTMGLCADVGSGFVDNIRKAYPLTINLGYSGNGPLAELAALKEYGSKSKPRNVLWFFFEGNDIPSNLEFERRSSILMNYLDAGYSQSLLDKTEKIDELLRAFVDEAYAVGDQEGAGKRSLFVKLWTFLSLSRTRNRLLPTPRADKADFDLFQKVLREADRSVREWGGRLTLVYLPAFSRFVDGPSDDVYEQVRLNTLATAGALNIRIVDMTTEFMQHHDPLSLFTTRTGGHYNNDGHELVSNAVKGVLNAD